MWLSAIHRDLPKREVTLSVDAEPITVGVANFDRMEEGQYVVVDNDENEFMLFHPKLMRLKSARFYLVFLARQRN
ncbi:hypothetical protein N5V81_13550 [Escherichia coli]|nr:hypothetical protein [Escherichia coli]